MKIDKTKDPNILDKVNDYKDTLYGNLSDPKYIYTESEFEVLDILTRIPFIYMQDSINQISNNIS